MKSSPTNQGIFLLASGALAIFATALVSCTTPREAAAQEALVCPQCRMVEVRNARAGSPWSYSSRRWGGAGGPSKIYEHRCEGCQGVMTTFFREGKFRHKRSICKEAPFTCPVVHPITARL